VTLMVRSHRLQRFGMCYCFAALLLLGGHAGYSQSPAAQPPSPDPHAIAIKTELVVLPVRVIDGHGDFVSGLSPDNFRVYQDGGLQRISLFQQEDTPVSVGLIVDHSRSMGPKLAEVTAAIVAFAQSSNPQDEMFVVDFNDTVSLETRDGRAFTHDPAELARAVSAVSARGQTALYDAVNEGLKHLQLAHGDKKALIIVSDGGDNASQHTYGDVLALARRSQTVIYSIGLFSDSSAEENPKVLRRLSEDTGGIAFFPDAGESVKSVSARIARDLREQYTLGFAPDKRPNDNGRAYHKVDLKVSAPGRGKIRVQTRRGYSNSEMPAALGKRAS
jgi:Ca-activated chloride channel family protein